MNASRILTTAVLAGIAILNAADLPAGVSALEGRFLGNVRRITSPERFLKAGEGYFSPDGKDIVYQAVPPGYPFYQIYTQPLDGGEPLRISTGRGRTTCAYFSPDGSRILFASSHLDPNIEETEIEARRQNAEDAAQGRKRRYSWPFDPWTDIFVADREGRIVDRLTTEEGYDAEGAFSRDGTKIAFCSTRDGDPDLYIMDADGKNVRRLTDAPGYDGGPFISPDGRWVVFRTDRKKEHYLQIHVIGIDGRNETVVTDNVGVNWAPYWHPTEPYLIWTGADHSNPDVPPNYDLWMMRYTIEDDRFIPGEWIRVTDHPSADVLPVFSPDGKQLMWTSNRGESGTSQLWIADFTLPEE
jgi:Tol biopolymer transport system component